MSHDVCTKCEGTGNGHGHDRYGERNPCEACNGLGYIDAVDDDAPPVKVPAGRTALFHGEERNTVHYAICGKSVDDCTVCLAPTYGGDAYLPDLTAARKLNSFICIAHFSPFSKSTSHITVTTRDGGWIDLHTEEATKLNKRILKYRNTGT